MKVKATILSILLLALNFTAPAQDLVNNGIFHLNEDAAVYVNGSIENNNFLQNQGALMLNGDWYNNKIYQGKGSLAFLGSDEQQIHHNDQPVNKIIFDGGGSKIVSGEILVQSEVSFLKGIVMAGEEDFLLLKESAEIVGGFESSYVDGPLYWEGKGYKFYPIGKNGHYRPVELIDITGINPITGMEVVEEAPELSVANIVVSEKRYWTRKQYSGTFLNSPIALHFGADDAIEDLERIVILEGGGDGVNVISSVLSRGTTEKGSVQSVDAIQGENYFIGIKPEEDPEAAFFIPNTLSPTAASEENRVLKVYGDGIAEDNFHFAVYNRWGIKLYETGSLQHMQQNGWDGIQQNGRSLARGSYPYVLQMKRNGEIIKKSGMVAIIK